MPAESLQIRVDDLSGGDVIALLEEHLADMYATSPPECVHALDVDKLQAPDITFFAARSGHKLLGCIALKHLNAAQAEIKSMRTPASARRTGTGKRLLEHVIDYATNTGYQSLWLETGSMDFFAPARQLYLGYGFQFCGPFADYQADPNSCFMCKTL